MSKRGPRPTVPAYRRSGFIRPPPIGRDAAEATYGAPLPDPAWRRIVAAFDDFGQMLDVLVGPRLSAYAASRDRAQRELVAAFEAVVRLQGDPALAAMRAASLDADIEGAPVGGLGAALDAAAKALRPAVLLVAAARRPATATFSEKDAQQWLAREILAALAAAGADARLSHGWAEPDSDADLAPAERLLCALDVPPGDTPGTRARWIRRAAEDATRG